MGGRSGKGSWSKGQIERFFRTVCNKFTRWMKSYTGTLTGSKTSDKVDKDIKRMLERGELLTLEEFYEKWHEWLTTVYMHTEHSGLKKMGETYKKPYDCFMNEDRYFKAAPPKSYATMLMMKSENVLVRNIGITKWGYEYRSDELCDYIGRKVDIKYDPDDMAVLYVFDQKGKRICEAYCQELLQIAPKVTQKALEEHLKMQKRQQKRDRERLEEARRPFEELNEQYVGFNETTGGTELEKKVREFLAATGGVAEGQEPENSVPTGAGKLKKKVEFFESRDFVQTIGVCQACQEYMGLGIIVGKSGQGKTHALKKYAELPRVAYIECDDTMACRDLVEAIENGIGLPKGYGGTIWSRVNRIREFFNTNEGFLLIIDEADKLINKYTQKKMEILRGIFDQSDVGIVIAGEPRLETELKGNLARFANRMDFYYKLKGLSKNEVVDYLEGYEVDEAVMGEMISRATNTQSGCFRLLDRTLNNVLRILKQKGETRITMKIVSEASNMMML